MPETLDTVGSLGGGLLNFVLAFAGYGMASTVLQPPGTRPLSRSSSASNPTPSTASPSSVSLWNPSFVLLIVFAARPGPLRTGDQDWASGAVLALAVTTVATKFASLGVAGLAIG